MKDAKAGTSSADIVARQPSVGTIGGGSLNRSLGYAVRKAQIYAYQQYAAVMQEFEVRPVQYALLMLIHEHPAMPQSAAGIELCIEKGNLTGLLRELEERGLTTRKNSSTDRRAHTLHLTARGTTLIRKVMKRHDRYEEALAAKVGPDGHALLLSLLHQLVSDSTT